MPGGNFIGILSYNKPNLTIKCLDSVIGAGYDPASVFLLHNGSTGEVFSELSKLYSAIHHKWVRENRGYSGGFNALMHWAFDSGGRSVLFLTNDTLIDRMTLPNLLETGTETGAGFIAPAIYYLNHPGKLDSCGGFFDRDRFTLSHYHEIPLPEFLEPGKDYIPGTALWMREDVFRSTGGMDERFHTYWEDADISFRSHLSGIRMARSPGSSVYHGIGRTCHKNPLYTTYYFQRNRIIFCRQYLNGTELEQALEQIKQDIREIKKKSHVNKSINKARYIRDLENFFNQNSV